MGGHRTIVGVNVTNVGSDMGSLAPMVEQIAERTGHLPQKGTKGHFRYFHAPGDENSRILSVIRRNPRYENPKVGMA